MSVWGIAINKLRAVSQICVSCLNTGVLKWENAVVAEAGL